MSPSTMRYGFRNEVEISEAWMKSLPSDTEETKSETDLRSTAISGLIT